MATVNNLTRQCVLQAVQAVLAILSKFSIGVLSLDFSGVPVHSDLSLFRGLR